MDDRVAIALASPSIPRRFWTRLKEPYPDPGRHRRLLRRLNPRDGERVLRVVPKHPVVYLPVALAIGGLIVAVVAAAVVWNVGTQILVLAAFAAVAVTLARAYAEWLDVFVLTNWRVVRLSGVLTTRAATMPINRILDMTMTRTPCGRLVGYGHFVFESAAQEQGLREIRFVPNILAVDREINDAVHAESRRREQFSSQVRARRSAVADVEPTEPIGDR